MTQRQDWHDRSITVLGLSRSGAAVARYVTRHGGRVFLSDTAPATPANENLRQELQALGVQLEMGGHGQQCFSHSELIVVSPGIPPNSDVMEQLRLSGKTILSEVEFAAQQVPKTPIIGITGTNGKSTTTTLIAWILSEAGLEAPACGNIGIPITDILNDVDQNKRPQPDYLVAELSSFQLEFSPTLHPKVGVLTNFKPDHLDWHGGLDAYREAKLSLFSGQRAPEWSILPADDPTGSHAASKTPHQVLWFSRNEDTVSRHANKIYLDRRGQFTLKLDGQAPIILFAAKDLSIIGDHNEENVLMSAAAAYLSGISPADIAKACLAFQGLEHRLEKLPPIKTESGDILFFNDSKATNTDAAISALKAFKTQPVILIAGGYDKMTPLDEFVEEVRQHAKSVILIGAARERFARALAEVGYDTVTYAPNLETATADALQLSQGEPVLFSPACSSFDMFRNFEERGRVFKAAVDKLRNATTVTPGRNSGLTATAATPSADAPLGRG